MFPKFIATSKNFFGPIHSNLIGFNVHKRQDLLSRWRFSHLCGPMASPSVGMVLNNLLLSLRTRLDYGEEVHLS